MDERDGIEHEAMDVGSDRLSVLQQRDTPRLSEVSRLDSCFHGWEDINWVDQMAGTACQPTSMPFSSTDENQLYSTERLTHSSWSSELDAPSSGGSTLSSVSPEMPCPTLYHLCPWSGCWHLSFATRDEWAWHIKAEHLLECPVCAQCCHDASDLSSHIDTQHAVGPSFARVFQPMDVVKISHLHLSPRCAERDDASHELPSGFLAYNPHRSEKLDVKEWKLERIPHHVIAGSSSSCCVDSDVVKAKVRCRDKVQKILEKRARENNIDTSALPIDDVAVRRRAWATLDVASFPLLFEHAILPFLADFLPKWSGPQHVISCTRGTTPISRRVCIMTTTALSRARKVMIAQHVGDLLPSQTRSNVNFVFSIGSVIHAVRWARGLDRAHPDLVAAARNPYRFGVPCMGDSVGVGWPDEAFCGTATLGPCLDIDGAPYWLVNYHPFLKAWCGLQNVDIEHPSPQDRDACLIEGHDALTGGASSFSLGHMVATSGLDLKTTRISHEPYWEENEKDPALVVTDWALVAASADNRERANMLRKFPSENQPPYLEPLVKSSSTRADGIVAGAPVFSSGRTSGFQRGQVCEVPAYVSGAANGTGKATREWFVEEPLEPGDDGDDWIRGGIGVEGDSGAAIIDANTNQLYGQLWGRNRYWGPGPRITYFTPAADILDDIQEKCGLQMRPQLPQTRPDAERYATYPSCRSCYDARMYSDSRRSSRFSMQSMINSTGDAEPDQVSLDMSELATPGDPFCRGVRSSEQVGALVTAATGGSPFSTFSSFSAASPATAQGASPYPQYLVLDNIATVLSADRLQEAAATAEPSAKKRSARLEQGSVSSSDCIDSPSKRQRTSYD